MKNTQKTNVFLIFHLAFPWGRTVDFNILFLTQALLLVLWNPKNITEHQEFVSTIFNVYFTLRCWNLCWLNVLLFICLDNLFSFCSLKCGENNILRCNLHKISGHKISLQGVCLFFKLTYKNNSPYLTVLLPH